MSAPSLRNVMQTPQREFASAKVHKKNDIRKFVCHFYAFLYFSYIFFITVFLRCR